ncbi:MAG TPA: ABC transporter permease [Solirubrobacter sp.]|nr:ABC transporter permease [Solirubrobacter sp.]
MSAATARANAPLRVPDAALPWLGVLIVLVALELIVRVGLISGRYFPPVTETGAALVGLLGEGAYWTAILHTLQGYAIGLAIAIAIAVPVGLALGFSDVAYHAARPAVEFLRPVPSVALIPLAILVYGTGLQSKVFLVAFASTWPLLIQTIYGARDLEPLQLETARSFRIRRSDRFLRVTLMGAVPYIATGLRIASATALILAITAELIIGAAGLGRSINLARQGGAVDEMYALIVTTGLLGWALNSLFAVGERRVLHWHPSHRNDAA